MDYLTITREYDIDDIPSRENIPEIKDDPSLDMVLSYTVDFRDDIKVVSDNVTLLKPFSEIKKGRITIYDPARLPLPEREYCTDRNELLNFTRRDYLKFRPVEILTRAECNTIAGRTKLMEWERSHPRLENGVVVSGFNMVETSERKRRNPFDEPQFTPKETIGYILYASADPETRKYIFRGLWGHGVNTSSEDIISAYHPDLLFANIEGHEITERNQFREVVEKYATNIRVNRYVLSELYGEEVVPIDQDYTAEQAVEMLMKIYDDCQRGIDGLWATYELFRTENFVSIADMSQDAQQVAVRNYLRLFREHNSKNGLLRDIWSLKYNGRVTVKVRNRLGIPPEIWRYAENIDTIPSEIKPKNAPNTQSVITDRIPIISQEQDRQRIDYKGQFELVFSGYMGKAKDGRRFDDEWKHELVVRHTQIRKLCFSMLHYIISVAGVDVYDYARRVNEAETLDDVTFLTKHPFVVSVDDIVKTTYRGRMSNSNRDELIEIIKSLPDEPYILNQSFTFYDRKQRKHITIRLTPSQVSKYRGKKGFRELEITQPIFTFNGWAKETNGKESKKRFLVTVNPVFFAKMIGSRGEMTNYIKLSPDYMAYIDQIPNTKTGETISAVEIILQTIRGARLKQYKIAKADKKADFLTFEMSQSEFYDIVCRHVQQSTSSNISRDRQRMKQNIIKAFETLKKHHVHIKDYKTSKDGKKWTIRFIEPS